MEATLGHHGYSEVTLSCVEQSRAAGCLVFIVLFKVSSVGERKIFHYILRFHVWRTMSYTNKRMDQQEKKTYSFLRLILTDKGVVRKEAKLKDLARPGNCYTTSQGQVMKKRPGSAWWKPLEDEGYFYKVCLCRFLSMSTLHIWW